MQRWNHKSSSTAVLTVLALIAFAGNSVFCRLALGKFTIDPASYTAARLISGALTLWVIARFLRNTASAKSGGGWISAAMLFLYAIAFSVAYISLSAGTGALILFASVQITMITVGLYDGERPDVSGVVGAMHRDCRFDLFGISWDHSPFPVWVGSHGHCRHRLGHLLPSGPGRD